MKIVRIEVTCESAEEADVEISDGVHTLVAFSQPCFCKVGQEIDETDLFVEVENIYLSNNETPRIEKKEGEYYQYKIYAEILNYKSAIVAVGGIKFCVKCGIPFFASEGDIVEIDVEWVSV